MELNRYLILRSCITALIFQGFLVASNSLSIVSRDSATDITFHDVYGRDILLSEAASVATRSKDYCYGITFSNRPVKVNERIHVKILETELMWAGNLQVGFTSSNPVTLQKYMTRCQYPREINTQTWSKFIHQEYAHRGGILFFYYNETGDVHIGTRDEDNVLISGIYANDDLWAVFHLYGRTKSIRLVGISCSSDTCQNGGTCEKDLELNTLQCYCQFGYEGSKCEEKILCDNSTCKNGGSCSQDGANGTYRCSCVQGYKGLSCGEEFVAYSAIIIEYLDFIGAVVGVILLIIVIFAVVKFFRWKRKELKKQSQGSTSLIDSDASDDGRS